MKERLIGSLAVGMAAAVALVLFEARYRHAALVASAAKSGGHETVRSILVDGFIGVTIGVTVLVFVLATLGTRRHARATRRQDSPQRRRRPRADAWR